MSGFGNQMRFVVFIHTLKEVTAAPPNSSVHLKVKYQNTSLRTKSYKLEKGRVLFDETFAFGRKQGKESDQITIQLRQDSIMSKSSRIGAVSVPLGDVLIGGKIDREVDFYPQGSGYISLSIETDSSAPLPLNNITQLNAASAGHDSDDEEFIPIGNLMGGIRKSGGGVGGKKGKPKHNSENDMDAPGGDGGFGSSARGGGGGSTTAGGKTVIDPRTGKKTYIPAATAAPDVPTASSSATRTNNNTAASSIHPQPSTNFPNNSTVPAHASHPAGTTAPPAPTQRKKPKMRDGGSQTDMPQLSKEEIAALYDFHVPENAVSISYNSPSSSPVGGTTPASYRRSPTGSVAPGAFSRIPTTRDRTVSSHGSGSMMNQQTTLGAPQQQQQHLDVNKAEMVAAANRNPRLQAMKNAAIAWPSDEVESIILYAQQMEKQRDDAEQRLAKVYAARAQQNAVALKDIPAARKRSLANGAPRSATTAAAAAVGSPLRRHHPNMAPPTSTHPQSTTTSSRPAQLDDDEDVPQWVHNFITLKEQQQQQQTPAGGSVPEQHQWHRSSAPPVLGGRSQLMSNLVNGGLTQGDKAHILANYSEL